MKTGITIVQMSDARKSPAAISPCMMEKMSVATYIPTRSIMPAIAKNLFNFINIPLFLMAAQESDTDPVDANAVCDVIIA